MGLLANIFGSSNIKKDRQKNRNFRVCRIEEMESRDLLSAAPFDAPDSINFGVVFHDSYCCTLHEEHGKIAEADTFTVSWNGGVEGTRLTELVIHLGTANAEGGLFFDTTTFALADWTGIKNVRFSQDAQWLSIEFDENFVGTSLAFNVAVYQGTKGNPEPIVGGNSFANATVWATFVAENFEKCVIEKKFENDYGDPATDKGLALPAADACAPGQANKTSAAGAVESKQQEALTGTISGFVYDDANNNGIKEIGEKGIVGVTLELWVWNGTEYVDTHERAITGEDGSYKFEGVEAFKMYQIRETQPDGYEDGKESVGTIDGVKTGTLPDRDDDTIGGIWMSSNGIGENYNFGEYKNGSISGRVYEDGGDPIPGTTVELYDKDGKLIATTKTDDDGNYEFTGLPPGEYWVKEYRSDEYCGGGGFPGNLTGEYREDDNSIRDIIIRSGDDGIHYDFFANRRGEISGYVYLDANKDGERNEGELGIEGVVLSLWRWDDAQQRYVDTGKTTTTDADGFYIFAGLCSGVKFQIRETQPGGYDQGSNSIGSLGGEFTGEVDIISAIPMIPNGKGENYNFGELEKPSAPPVIPVVPPTQPSYPGSSVPAPQPFRVPSGPTIMGGQPVAMGVPGWQAANFTEPLRGGFGSGGMAGTGGGASYSWQLSIVNAGYPRANGATDGIAIGEHASKTTMLLSDSDSEGAANGARYVSVSWAPLPMNQAGWFVRGKDGMVRKRFTFGPEGGIPVVGDFNGDGIADVAVYHNGNWYIDINGNGKWDEEDLWAQMGGPADQPVVGDWDGDGKTDIGTFGPMGGNDLHLVAAKPGLPTDLNATVSTVPKNMPPDIAVNVSMNNVRAMKHSASGGVRLDVMDHVFQYGNEGDKAFTGDFSGDGIATVGIYRDGKWYIDRAGTGKWDENAVFVDNADFGLGTGGIPVIGDFNGDGIDKIGLYKDGVWHLDTTGDFRFDTRIEFGQAGDYPVVGDFDGSGIAQLAVYRAGSADLIASGAPEPMTAAGEGMVARQFTGEVAEEDQGMLKNHSRSETTPHTNAPLLRGR